MLDDARSRPEAARERFGIVHGPAEVGDHAPVGTPRHVAQHDGLEVAQRRGDAELEQLDGHRGVSLATGLVESPITTKRSAAPATIFSRVCAPPPPFTTQPSGAIWSAPSMARSKRSVDPNPSIGIPRARAASSVRGDVATQRMRRRRAASAGNRNATVVPVPSPTVIPLSTSSAAASAAACFS